MIGDVLNSDIKAGLAAGTHTILVLSGKDTQENVNKSEVKPEYIYTDLGEVLAHLA